MAKIEDGGAAFPTFAKAGDCALSEGGLTARDWFAGQAPDAPDWFEHPGHPVYPRAKSINAAGAPAYDDGVIEEYRRGVQRWNLAREAAWRFSYADAMLAARKGGE